MSLAEGPGVSSSPECEALGDVLEFFGDVADFAAGVRPGGGERIAAIAVAMARLEGCDAAQTAALYYASRLRNAGSLGSPAFRKGAASSERELRQARWDVPVTGARRCERIAALPPGTADIVRWQAECWDGTGFPDGLRWRGIPREAQLLHIAAVYDGYTDPEEGLAAVGRAGGRLFGPEQTRTFVRWFHSSGGEAEPVSPPLQALQADCAGADDALALLAEAACEHAGSTDLQTAACAQQDAALLISRVLKIGAPVTRLERSRAFSGAARRALQERRM